MSPITWVGLILLVWLLTTWVCLILLLWLIFRPPRQRQKSFEVPSYALARIACSKAAHARLTRTDPDGTRTRVSRET